jgi:hypothetical protein
MQRIAIYLGYEGDDSELSDTEGEKDSDSGSHWLFHCVVLCISIKELGTIITALRTRTTQDFIMLHVLGIDTHINTRDSSLRYQASGNTAIRHHWLIST